MPPTTKTTRSLSDGLRPGDEWEYVQAVLGHAPRVMLYGPPGTGKTTIANRFGKPSKVFNVYLTEDTPAAELRGHFVPKGGEWLWMHGPCVRAWIDGARLVLNEINNASGDALDLLLAILDDPEIAALTLPTGETVHPAEGCQVVATMNGEPEDLPEALADRFSVRFRIDRAHPEALASLPPDIRALAMARAAEPSGAPSVRAWQAFRDLREKTTAEVAAVAVFGPQEAQAVLDALTLRATKTAS